MSDPGYGSPGFARPEATLGGGHAFRSVGGFVAGYSNAVTGEYASVLGGTWNGPSGYVDTVTGGGVNVARRLVDRRGGTSSIAEADYSSVAGGSANNAMEPYQHLP